MDWKKTILEMVDEKDLDKYQIYCDMDGVLVDFEKGIEDAANELMRTAAAKPRYYQSLEPDRKNYDYMLYKYAKKTALQLGGWDKHVTFEDFMSRDKGQRAVRNMMYWYIARTRSWWAELDWAPGGQQLWNFISKYDSKILTAPVGPLSALGKKDWCQTNLGLSGADVTVIENKGINTGDKFGILIDDREKYIEQFSGTGGIGILYKTGNPGDAIKKLQELGF